MGMSFWHLLLILIVVFTVFGAGKLPKVMGEVGKGIRNMREGLKGEEEVTVIPPTKTIDQDPNA